MKKLIFVMLFVAVSFISPTLVFALPTVYPTGTTIYKPDKTWSGYTIFATGDNAGCALIDMNGNTVKFWEGPLGTPGPIKMLPGGVIMGPVGSHRGHQEFNKLIMVDWDGNIIWSFDKLEKINEAGSAPFWSARQHHDFQVEGNPVGYYVPGMDFKNNGKVLIVGHRNWINPAMSQIMLEDDIIYEIDRSGKILWQWVAGEHFDEMGFDEAAKNAIGRDPNVPHIAGVSGKAGDWMHINDANYLGPNKWYDNGDERFHPDNIITDGRQINTILIIDKKTGKIVWQVGPDFTRTPALRKMGQIIGQHHAHMIPKGLPGEGNILVFDNGGWAGYGIPTPGAPQGIGNAQRDHSRVLEFDPITLEIKWEYSAKAAGFMMGDYLFYSSHVSSVQRLPNGNTFITEGVPGRLIEVTNDHEIVWEYVSPYFGSGPIPGGEKTSNMIYRAYRVPYDWVPQLKKPVEKTVIPPANWNFNLPGTKREVNDGAITKVKGLEPPKSPAGQMRREGPPQDTN